LKSTPFLTQRAARIGFIVGQQSRGFAMPTLQIGTRIFHADAQRVASEAERMFRMSPERRRHRLEAAKTKLVRAVASEHGNEATAAARAAAATILSQGIAAI
jgi:hypothetical protein